MVLDIIYGFFFNFILIVFAVIAGLRAEHNKKPWGFFITGIVIQLFTDSGMLLAIAQGNKYLTSGDISSLIFTAIIIIFGYMIIRKTYKQAQKEASINSRIKGEEQ